MSDPKYICCESCDEILRVGQTSGGEFTLYYGNVEAMRLLEAFLAAHLSHDLTVVGDEWPKPRRPIETYKETGAPHGSA